MGDVAELLVGLVLLLFGALMGPAIEPKPRPLAAFLLLIVGLILTLLGALSFAGAGS